MALIEPIFCTPHKFAEIRACTLVHSCLNLWWGFFWRLNPPLLGLLTILSKRLNDPFAFVWGSQSHRPVFFKTFIQAWRQAHLYFFQFLRSAYIQAFPQTSLFLIHPKLPFGFLRSYDFHLCFRFICSNAVLSLLPPYSELPTRRWLFFCVVHSGTYSRFHAAVEI